MSNYLTTPNMNLVLPVPTVDPGPDYADVLNAALARIDSHNHSSGNGVQINPSGLNINTDLPFLGNNATLLRSTRFSPQNSPLSGASDLGCCYVSGVDLYYNDVAGNQVRMTQSGGVAGSQGSIANLTSPASASYVSGNSTFVWQSAASTPANMDGGSFIFRNITASSKGITVSAPSALAANYSLIWPSALPSAQSFATIDNSGNIAAPVAFNQGLTRSNFSPLGRQYSSSCGVYSFTGSFAQITNFSNTLTTSGGDVIVALTSDGSGNPGYILANQTTSSSGPTGYIRIKRDGSEVYRTAVFIQASTTDASMIVPSSSIFFIDQAPSPGSHTYTVEAELAGGLSVLIQYSILATREVL